MRKKNLSLFNWAYDVGSVKWSRLTINLDEATAAAAKENARRQRRSFAAYVATLIERDLAAMEATRPGPVGPLVAEDTAGAAALRLTVDEMSRGEQRRREQQESRYPAGRGGAPKVSASGKTDRK